MKNLKKMKTIEKICLLMLFTGIVLTAIPQSVKIRNLEPAARVNEIYIKTANSYDTIRFANTEAGQLIRLNDFGTWEAWSPNYLTENDSLGFIMWGTVDVATTAISVTYPSPMPSANYLHDVKIEYTETINGKTGKLPNPAWGFEFTETGFTGNVKHAKGQLTWYVIRNNEKLSTINWDETDPFFSNSVAKGISQTDTSNWNAKPSDYEMRKAIKDSITQALMFKKDTSDYGISTVRFTTAVPESVNSPGVAGTLVITPMYIYFCVKENTWGATTLSAFPSKNE